VREAVFSTLVDWAGSVGVAPAEQLQGIGFLDLYAGSGAFALEAASRGASPVVAVERVAAVADLIHANATSLHLGVRVAASQVLQYLNSAATPYDIIFLDPPYETSNAEVTACLTAIMRSDWLVDNGIVVVERSIRTPAFEWPIELERRWQKPYGETIIYYGDRGVDPMLGENQTAQQTAQQTDTEPL
jgi:16S rRNA (guanine966-N2)-methyltransferase